jgi:uncharacterized membrane protein YjjP (DUF1212 family)
MMTSHSFQQRRQFVIKLGRALHKFGTPAYRLEAHLTNVADILAMRGSFIVTPTSLVFSLRTIDQQETQEHVHTLRVKPGDIDLGSLAETDELVQALANGQCTLSEAITKLSIIENKPDYYSPLTTLAAFGCCGGAFTMLMGSNWHSVLWSLLLSLLVYGFIYASYQCTRIANMLEPLVATVSAFLALGIAHIDSSINPSLVVLASIIVFIPGLSLTLGLRELAERDLLSGTARIMDALMLMFKLYFGTILGNAFGLIVWGKAIPIEVSAVPQWTAFIAIILLSSSLVVMFKIRLKDSLWGVIAGIIGYTTSLYAAQYFGFELGIFFGAFCVGIYANLYANLLNSPAIIVSLQGLVLLVPGSKLYMGLNTAITGQSIIAIEQLGQKSFLIFMSIIAGLIFSNVASSSRRTL